MGQIDKKREAVVSKEFLPKNLNLGQGKIELVEYRPNYLKYESEAEGDGLAVFSEIYTKEGWSVKIDGAPAKPLRADYILRALEIPAGRHTIEWSYRAPRWNLIEGITLAFSLVILLATLLILIYTLRNARRQKNQA